jgi:hypothetical protein
MLGAFQQAAAAGQGGEACVEAALDAAKDHPMARDEIAALATPSPLEAMLTAAARRPPQAPLGPAPPSAPVGGPAEAARETLESIETSTGASRAGARAAAASLLAAGQAIEAPSGSGGAPQKRVRQIEIVRQIEALSEDILADGAHLSAGDAPTADAQVEADDAAAPRSHGAAP